HITQSRDSFIKSPMLQMNDFFTWNEIDRLIEIVASLYRDHIDLPPKYSYNIDDQGGSALFDPPK
ncbi:5889_t:CDS:1, partial [Funneliformis geosporum]